MSEELKFQVQVAITQEDVEIVNMLAASMNKTTDLFVQEHVANPLAAVLKNMLDRFRQVSKQMQQGRQDVEALKQAAAAQAAAKSLPSSP